ncbi:hypothetical protein [Sinorhizobium arboris]|uniref:hypothetical protein n=1 Tax=Sinorhizobium arboris TaxID=76745 RepID=UPI00067EC07C|nr:hypothetical protein [Sinorhizobium arboris]
MDYPGCPRSGVYGSVRGAGKQALNVRLAAIAAVATAAACGVAQAQDSSGADLAKQLSNPIASLISVPFQLNYDRGFGPDDGHRVTLNVQPVIPVSLNEDWNLISRTILPVISQSDIAGPSGDQFGLGDTVQSFFFSPKEPTAGGIIWGAGPVFLIPTGTDDLLGGEKWGIGPTAVVLKQDGPWTYGALANHIWSFAGDDDRADVNSTFLQPFLSYTTPDAWTFAVNTESTYDWESDEWSVPINFQVSKLVKVGEQPVSITAGARYWAAAPDNGPQGWGARLAVTFLFPK